MALKAGDMAPSFEGRTTDGSWVKLSDFRGKKLVLYFYPKDDTPGCTREACSFRDHIEKFRARGVEVLGVSTDDVASHQKFTRKFQLNFPLLADPDKSIGRAYGVVGGLYGLVGLARRWTFVIDEQGRIVRVFDKVNPRTHVDEVLAAL